MSKKFKLDTKFEYRNFLKIIYVFTSLAWMPFALRVCYIPAGMCLTSNAKIKSGYSV